MSETHRCRAVVFGIGRLCRLPICMFDHICFEKVLEICWQRLQLTAQRDCEKKFALRVGVAPYLPLSFWFLHGLASRRRKRAEQGFGQSDGPSRLRHTRMPGRAFSQKGTIGFARDPVSEKQLRSADFRQ